MTRTPETWEERMTLQTASGRCRATIERLRPQVGCGRFAIKRSAGERVEVEADIYADGHDRVQAALLYRKEAEGQWRRVPMVSLGNDRWQAGFRVDGIGTFLYCVQAWIDQFQTWRDDMFKRLQAGEAEAVDFQIGALIVEEAAKRASPEDASALESFAGRLRGTEGGFTGMAKASMDEGLAELMDRHPDTRLATTYSRELRVTVDPPRARFSAWYEFFPRSSAREANRHGTFADCEALLDYVASMGFDVVYFPPIHPIGSTQRKGRNNSPFCGPGDVGSPWAIGSRDGGHKAVHPELGSLADFERFVKKARSRGIETALDIALQCSPDHPYVHEHPKWFRTRPDGNIQYAENPPKKYQDIYPFDFECEQWMELWEELKSIFIFWLERGVRVFRVDNPHTKPFPFWEWLIREVKQAEPETVFLSEAFTRPKVMYRLAKVGFSQSYTYFSWRNTRQELTDYFTELTQTDLREYFRPSLWPNTPDILTEYLQFGGKPAFVARLILAATLGASYGVYGPAFELCEAAAREPGSEDYLHSEKYEVRHWEREDAASLRKLIARVNRIRRTNPALQHDWSLRFHPTDNDQMLCYTKNSDDLGNVICTVVNLDSFHIQRASIDLDLAALGMDGTWPYQAHDLLTDTRYLWQGSRSVVELDPAVVPASVFALRRRVRTERDFDYYL
jgi:starch synthase (maltosyl-transferring)